MRPSVAVVSIDLFDTLVYRACPSPLDVFRLQWRRFADAGWFAGPEQAWLDLRKGVEAHLAAIAWPGEVRLTDIYARIAATLAIPADVGDRMMALELEVEHEVIRPYERAFTLLRAILARDKRIVVLTDTYLPASFLEPLVSGFLGETVEIRCSSDTGQPKRSGLAYRRLRREFGMTVLHIGDNTVVDGQVSRRHGVASAPIRWPRHEALEGALGAAGYAEAMGAARIITPWDGTEDREDRARAREELAFRWSLVLADFTLAARRAAEAFDATDIWLLSRDCESISAATEQVAGFWGDRVVRYVACSRSSCHPVTAITDPALFFRWKGRHATVGEITDGAVAIQYYRGLAGATGRRILLVDMGWKGRLQHAIMQALPEHHVHGFYFSAESEAEAETIRRADIFLPWNLAVFNQPLVEALAGFTGPSCDRFVTVPDGTAQPQFRSGSGDRSPGDYCAALRRYMAELLGSAARDREPSETERLLVSRTRAVRSICRYPDRVVADAMASWRIGIGPDDEGLDLLNGGRASLLNRVRCAPVDGNVWPRGAIWGVTRTSLLVALAHGWADFAAWRRELARRFVSHVMGRSRRIRRSGEP